MPPLVQVPLPIAEDVPVALDRLITPSLSSLPLGLVRPPVEGHDLAPALQQLAPIGEDVWVVVEGEVVEDAVDAALSRLFALQADAPEGVVDLLVAVRPEDIKANCRKC